MTSPTTTLRPGDQLAAVASTVRVVVIRAPAGGRPLIACGGRPMEPAASAPPPAAQATAAGGPVLGKRYVDAAGTVELLCTSPGSGELTCDGVPMTIKAANALPASD